MSAENVTDMNTFCLEQMSLYHIRSHILEYSKAVIDRISDFSNKIIEDKYTEKEVDYIIDLHKRYYSNLNSYKFNFKDEYLLDINNKLCECVGTFIEFCNEYKRTRGWR